ncbi:hypothetical protein BCAR13_1540038 [Paraburkholderia caribensis]|nr:hypothetical protein BCAR13_1540038 [Paraburkholderia caribensis]
MQEVGQMDALTRVVGAMLHWNGPMRRGSVSIARASRHVRRDIGTLNVHKRENGACKYPKNGHIPMICLLFPYESITR